MKLTINREKLLDALQKTTSIIGTRSTLPILSNVLLEAENQKLTVTTTDLEIRITTEVEAKVEEGGKTTLPAKKLLSIIRELPGEEVAMAADQGHHTQINSGSSSFKLLGLVADDFPLPVDFNPIRRLNFSQEEMARMLGRISYAASSDDSRKVLNGILLSVKENAFTAVATDGKRLALVEKVLENFNGDEGDSIIPSKSANELQRLLEKEGDVALELGENQAAFRAGKSLLTTKLVEGSYPNYRQVIPTSFSKKIELPTEAFSAALRRVALMVSDSSSYIKLTFNDNCLQLSANSTEFGESNESLGIDFSGQEVAISFNPAYMAAPFRAIDADKVNLQVNDSYSPVALSVGEGFLYVIMPMRNK